MRYKQGVAALMQAPAALVARLNNQVMSVDSVRDADFYRANWQGLAPGSPLNAFYAGLNMLALSPQPSGAGYSVTVSCVGNMPLPATGNDPIQLGQDDLEAVLCYAQHLATFKSGGADFGDTYMLYEAFLRRCVLYNSKLAAQSDYKELMWARSQQERRENPVFTGPGPAETAGANAAS